MKTKSQLSVAVKLALASSLLPVSMQLSALEFQLTDDLKVSADTTLTYGRQWRVEGRDKGLLTYGDAATILGKAPGSSFDPLQTPFKELVQRTNADDGTRNFDKWDVVSSRVAFISDVDISYKNLGLFLRPQIFYDEVPFGETSYDCKYHCNPALYSAGYELTGTNNSLVAGEASNNDHFSDDYQDTLGYDARFLDAYVYGNFQIGDSNLDVRIGRQVISWGEALILQGGIGFAQNRVDSSAATQPGVELKEIFLPTGAIYGQLGVTEQLTLEAYWQYEWIPSTLFPTGSFFSMQDFIDGNANAFLTHDGASFGSGYFLRNNDNEPDNDKQFGLAARYLLGEGTEAAFYLVNYHDKYPMFWAFNSTGDQSGYSGATGPGGDYTISYFDNIRMYGVTLNTVVNTTQVGIEYAYRANAPVVPACTEASMRSATCRDPFYYSLMNDLGLPYGSYPAPGSENALVSHPIRAEVHSYNFGITHTFQPTMFWDNAILAAELGGWYIGSGLENDDLQYAHLGAFTKTGQGIAGQFMPEYKNVMEGVDLTVPIFVSYGLEGSLSTFNYTEKNLWWSVGVEAVYLENWRFATYYNNFSGPNNLWVDRDNISVNVKYTF